MFQIDKLQYLQIGVQGENAALQLQIDMTSWVEELPNDVTYHILFKPYNDATPVPMETGYADNILTWTVTLSATQNVGVGYTEVRAINSSGLVKKSKIIPTAVESSVSGTEASEPPASYQGWVNQVLGAASDAEAYARGTRSGSAVQSTDPAYHNNSLYYDGQAEKWATGGSGGTPSATNNAEYFAGQAEGSAEEAEAWATGGTSGTPGATNNAKYYAEHTESIIEAATTEAIAAATEAAVASATEEAAGYAEEAEAWATGGTEGTPSETNNAKYYSEQSASSATTASDKADLAQAWATGGSGGTPSATNNCKYYRDSAAAIAAGDVIDDTAGAGDVDLTWSADKLNGLKSALDSIGFSLQFPYYRVRICDENPVVFEKYPSASDSRNLGFSRIGQIIKIDGVVDARDYYYMKLSNTASRTMSSNTVKTWDTPFSLTVGHRYQARLYFLSGTKQTDKAESISIYRAGESSSIGSAYVTDDGTIVRDFTPDVSSVHVSFTVYLGTYTDCTYFYELIDLTELEKELENLKEPAWNLIDLQKIENVNCNSLSKSSTGITLTCGTGTYRYAKLIMPVTPNKTYIFTSEIQEDENDRKGWIGWVQTDDLSSWPTSNSIIINSAKLANHLIIFSLTPSKPYVMFRFYANGNVDAKNHTVTFDKISFCAIENSIGYCNNITAVDSYVRNVFKKDNNLFNKWKIIRAGSHPADIYATNTGIRIVANDSAYCNGYLKLTLKPEETYALSLIYKHNSGARAWIGYVESDTDSDYPSSNAVLFNKSNIANDGRVVVYITPTKPYQLLRLYGNGSQAVAGDAEFSDIVLELQDNLSLKVHDNKKAQASMLMQCVPTSGIQPIKSKCKLLFFTDIHKDVTRALRVRRLAERWGDDYIDAVISGGDMVTNAIGENESERETNAGYYNSVFSGFALPLMNAIGNHDAWTKQAIYSPIAEFYWANLTDIYNLFIKPYAESSGYIQPTNAETNGYCYFYKDFNEAVRIIVIDGNYQHFDLAQQTWFDGVLTDARTNGLHVICVTHHPFGGQYQTIMDCTWKSQRASAYGPRVQMQTPIEAADSVNAFINAGGTFICWIVGHTHYDSVWNLGKDQVKPYNNQIVVGCASSSNQQSASYNKGTDKTTYGYDCMTYVVCDTNAEAIKFLRVGANVDFYGNERNGLIINYNDHTIYGSW